MEQQQVGLAGRAPSGQPACRAGKNGGYEMASLLEPVPVTFFVWLCGRLQAELEKLK